MREQLLSETTTEDDGDAAIDRRCGEEEANAGPDQNIRDPLLLLLLPSPDAPSRISFLIYSLSGDACHFPAAMFILPLSPLLSHRCYLRRLHHSPSYTISVGYLISSTIIVSMRETERRVSWIAHQKNKKVSNCRVISSNGITLLTLSLSFQFYFFFLTQLQTDREQPFIPLKKQS